MKSSAIVILGGAVVALGYAALLTLAVEESPARQEPEGNAAALAPPTGPGPSEVTRMRAEVAALRAQVAGLEAPERGAPVEPETPRELSREEQMAADEQLHASYVAQVEDTYERDRADPTWSASTTTRVWDTIRRLDFMRDAARSVDCRSRTCRIEVEDDGSGVLQHNLPVFGMEFADVLPVLAAGNPVRGEGGRERLVLYLMEADQRPPAARVD